MSRLANRVQKLETGHGRLDMEQLQRNNPGVDLSVLSPRHLQMFAEKQRNTTSRRLREFSDQELKESIAFSILFIAHAEGDEPAKASAIAVLDGKREFRTDELLSIVHKNREQEERGHGN
jgi:hypothetical protein